MAAKKTEATTAKAEAKKDNTVKVFIPYEEGEKKEQFVGVNGKTYQIVKGKWVDVPPEVAEVIQNSDLQMISARDNQEKFEEQFFGEM
jgi:hypothetical protein